MKRRKVLDITKIYRIILSVYISSKKKKYVVFAFRDGGIKLTKWVTWKGKKLREVGMGYIEVSKEEILEELLE